MKKTTTHETAGLNRMLILVITGGILLCPAVSPAHVDVLPSQAKALLDGDDPPIVIDVREVYEYCDAVGHIPGALNYPWYGGALSSRVSELDPQARYLVVCKSGGRSNAAANFLDSAGFAHIYDMMGGMRSWQWETAGCVDSDGDGLNDDVDNAPAVYNPDQADSDGDGIGNVADADYPRLYVADRVDLFDFAVLALQWRRVGTQLPADLDRDGAVGPGDMVTLVEHWLE